MGQEELTHGAIYEQTNEIQVFHRSAGRSCARRIACARSAPASSRHRPASVDRRRSVGEGLEVPKMPLHSIQRREMRARY